MMPRILYALVFCAVLPAILWAWADGLDRVVSLPQVHHHALGLALTISGFTLMLAAMWSLKHHGDGLPMNAFPPQRFVSRGIYAIFAHPIYVGFVLACAGVSVWKGSPSGLWIITPIVALAGWALVAGYERDAIAARFGATVVRPRLSLPIPTEERPVPWDFAAVLVLVFLPWLIMYEAVGHVPTPNAIASHLTFERDWPVWVWTEAVYISTYPWAVLAVFASRTKRDLRAFGIEGLVATFLGLILYLTLPFLAPPRDFAGEGVWASLLRWERADGLDGRASLPAFHVFWALAGARHYARRFPRLAWACWGWGFAIAASCVTTGMHSLADILAGVVFAIIVWHARSLWVFVLRAAETVANSWREWHVGPLRIIVHGAYAGLGAFVGMLVWSSLAPESRLPWLALVAIAGIVGAGVWGTSA
jgi:protein-S-isoprenylcysteine O-methyltransferase Ste14/membrane-associated phospholipid phosphatase